VPQSPLACAYQFVSKELPVILDDFVMLGTTVPEPNSDGRVFVCSAGVSHELKSLVRIYPLARRAVPHRWGEFKVPLERNPRDSRPESWQIRADRSLGHHWAINNTFETLREAIPASQRADLVEPFMVSSIQEANDRRLSLAIIRPTSIEPYLQANASAPSDEQLTLFDAGQDAEASGARRFPWMPRLRFSDSGGKHDLMLRDWGVFELQRKHPEDYFREHFAGALHLSSDSSLLIGNMNNRRTTWLVISILSGAVREPTLFD
jgi:hypothetical protein